MLLIAPAWVIEQSVEFQKRRMQLDEQELQERFQRVRQKEESLRRIERARVTKRRVSNCAYAQQRLT